MSVLEKIELYFVSAPLPAPFSPSWVPGFTRPKFAFYLIRLITSDSVEGWSAFPGAGRPQHITGEKLRQLAGIDLIASSPQEAVAVLKSDFERYGKPVKELGLIPQ